jgi:hypothetical protein
MRLAHKKIALALALAATVGLAAAAIGAQRPKAKAKKRALQPFPAGMTKDFGRAEQGWIQLQLDNLAGRVGAIEPWTVERHPSVRDDRFGTLDKIARSMAGLRGFVPPARAASFNWANAPGHYAVEGYHGWVKDVAPDGTVAVQVMPKIRSLRGGVTSTVAHVIEFYRQVGGQWVLVGMDATNRGLGGFCVD